ncbi:MAG: hypothetical protein SNJ84_03885, partial [Verrucomicrobiia bacterium]
MAVTPQETQNPSPPTGKRTRWRPPPVPPSLLARATILTLVFLLLLIVSLLAIVRYFGLPAQAALFLKQELQRQGIEASFGKLYLDPLGRVVGRDVSVSKLAGSDEHFFTVERVRFDLNWISWWRGNPIVSGIILEEASLRYALAEDTAITLTRVRIDLSFDRRKLVVRDGRFFLGPIEFRFTGIVRSSDWTL